MVEITTRDLDEIRECLRAVSESWINGKPCIQTQASKSAELRGLINAYFASRENIVSIKEDV